MIPMSDLRVMRERQLNASAALDRSAGQDPYGSAAMCVITTTLVTYPLAAAEFYACNPELLTGTETEGAAATFTADSATVVYAVNVGTAIPPSGTKVVIHAAGGRWVFRYDG
jgi:hypothetical protein